MFNDIKKGFSFSLGRILSRLFLFLLVGVLFLLIGGCKANALTIQASGIDLYDSGYSESFNQSIWNNAVGRMVLPFDAGGYQAYFSRSNRTNSSHVKFNVNYVSYYFNSDSSFSRNIDFFIQYSSYSWNNLLDTKSDEPFTVGNINTWPFNATPACFGIFIVGQDQRFIQFNLVDTIQINTNTVAFHFTGTTPSYYNRFFVEVPILNDYDIDTNKYLVTPGISSIVLGDTNASVTDAIDSQTTSIINNNNTNSRSIISAITNLPSTIINGISSLFTSLWNNISGAFTTLFGWLSDIFDSIQDILSDDEPTSQYLEDFVDEFIGSNDNIILEFITLPIQFITAILNSNTCSSISLGTLYGTELVLPCLGSKIVNILGSTIYTFISTILTALIYWRLCSFLYDVIEKVMTLSLDVNEKFNIDL